MNKFREMRRKVGTQVELAELLNSSQQSIAKWEAGKAYPRRQTLKKLSEILGESEGDILNAIDESRNCREY